MSEKRMARRRATGESLELPTEIKDVFLSYSLLRFDDASTSHRLLSRACHYAAPIARKRGWTVGRLKEFSPKNGSLYGLNSNRGQEICVRTRSDGGFLEEDHILGTLLHELVHIVHGSHSAQFYDMLKDLWVEAEAIMFRERFNLPNPDRNWGAGRSLGSANSNVVRPPDQVGNWGPGRSLGGSISMQQARRRLLSEGRPLGGGPHNGIAPSEAAARAAFARWRLEDNHTCATQEYDEGVIISDENRPKQHAGVNVKKAPAAASALPSQIKRAQDVIVLEDSDEEEPVKGGIQRDSNSSAQPRKVQATVLLDLTNDDDESTWTCTTCAVANEEANLVCQECLSTRPGRWRCAKCTYVNVLNHLNCLMCHTQIA